MNFGTLSCSNMDHNVLESKTSRDCSLVLPLGACTFEIEISEFYVH